MNPKTGAPKTVRIGPFTFVVRWFDKTMWDVKEKDGWCDHDHQVIALYEGFSVERVAETFLHEVTHAVIGQAFLWGEDSTPSEENVVHVLGIALTAFWIQNPAAFRWWSKLIGGKKC